MIRSLLAPDLWKIKTMGDPEVEKSKRIGSRMMRNPEIGNKLRAGDEIKK